MSHLEPKDLEGYDDVLYDDEDEVVLDNDELVILGEDEYDYDLEDLDNGMYDSVEEFLASLED